MSDFFMIAIASIAVYPGIALGAVSRLVWFGIELGWQEATRRIEVYAFTKIALKGRHV